MITKEDKLIAKRMVELQRKFGASEEEILKTFDVSDKQEWNESELKEVEELKELGKQLTQIK